MIAKNEHNRDRAIQICTAGTSCDKHKYLSDHV